MGFFFLGSIISSIGFISIAALLWGLIITSVVLLLFSFKEKSWKLLLFSGLVFIIPGLVLFTQGGAFRLVLVFPVLAIVLAFIMKKIVKKNGEDIGL